MTRPTPRRDDEALLDIKQAARRLGVGVPTLYRWIGERRVPVVRLGRAVRFSPAALDRYVEQRTVYAREA
jgi:excisionase family DNA binding protein